MKKQSIFPFIFLFALPFCGCALTDASNSVKQKVVGGAKYISEKVKGVNKRTNPPNIVIVITDDQGYGDLGCTGNPVIKTPHTDKLARESVWLTDYHVAPTCSPTRAALMSGHWTNRTGSMAYDYGEIHVTGQ